MAATFTATNLTGVFTLPGVTVNSGSLGLQVNTSTKAATVAVGPSNVVFPAGPFFRVTLDNGSLTVAGVTFAGSFTVQQSTRPGFAPETLTLTPTPTAMLAADLNKDGRIDLVVGGTSGYAVYLGQATDSARNVISWTTAATVPTVAGPVLGLALADLDTDGYLDVVVTTATTTQVLRNLRVPARPGTASTSARPGTVSRRTRPAPAS